MYAVDDMTIFARVVERAGHAPTPPHRMRPPKSRAVINFTAERLPKLPPARMTTAREPVTQAGYISTTSVSQQKSHLRTAAGRYIWARSKSLLHHGQSLMSTTCPVQTAVPNVNCLIGCHREESRRFRAN